MNFAFGYEKELILQVLPSPSVYLFLVILRLSIHANFWQNTLM